MLNHFIAKNLNFSSLKIIILNESLHDLFINKNNIPIHIDLFLIIIILSISKLYPQFLFATQLLYNVCTPIYCLYKGKMEG